MNIGKFTRYCESHFSLTQLESSIRDQRQRPLIEAKTIFKIVREMPAFGLTSLLQVDQLGRTEQARKWYGSKRRLVASDTTIERSLRGMDLSGLRGIGYRLAEKLDKRGMLEDKLPSGRTVRLGIVDGSEFGGFPACVAVVAGKVDAVLDIEMSRGRGHELETSRRLLERVAGAFGKGKVDLIGTDGLYMTKTDFRTSIETYGSHLVVKTSEETLEVVQDAQGLFFSESGKVPEGVEHVTGTDVERGVSYEIFCAGGFEWEGLEYPLKVAYVKEVRLKPIRGREDEPFWVITTDETLSAEDMRYLAHRRWRIENHIFKRLNALVKSKRHLTHNPHVREALLLIWLIGITLVGAYFFERGMTSLLKEFPKATWAWATRMMLGSLWQGAVYEDAA